MKQIPNLFTLLNLVFGCLAIVYILQNGIAIQYSSAGAPYIDIPEKMGMAAIFIGLAGVVDFLDGFVARFFNASSEMGKQLDSLADVVSFGVAPSMILYQFLRMSYYQGEDGINQPVLLLFPAFIFAAAAAYRLAKFNLDTKQQYGFRGVPTPAAGITVAAFPLMYWHNNLPWLSDLLTNKWFLYLVIAILSALMVSNLPIMAMKFKSFKLSDNFPKIILLLIAVLAILFLHWTAVPVIFVAYILLSLLMRNQTT